MNDRLNLLAPDYSYYQLVSLSLLRILVGWHLLYEGMAKLANSNWTSAAYLLDSKWLFSGLAEWMVTNPGLLSLVDTLNIWGLTLIGLSLMLGLLSRWGSIAGACLLVLYYLFHPPLVGLEYSKPPEGSYLLVDKNLVEACALFVLAMFPTSHITGLDRFINKD
ncbi:MAG TPA: DoxX family membrane protein [Candidatus Marinimicrobia bacterium]|jgi:thiosulfate dehydrogenase [quinone] large subunit|nr:DoxX family membrane protein [Candidatus Neomarinimicrobiota bacterium]